MVTVMSDNMIGKTSLQIIKFIIKEDILAVGQGNCRIYLTLIDFNEAGACLLAC